MEKDLIKTRKAKVNGPNADTENNIKLRRNE